MDGVCRWFGGMGIVALFAAGQGCSLTFDVHASAQTTVMGSSLPNLPIDFGTLGDFGAFDITQTQDFQNQHISKSQVESVKLTSLTLTITQPPGNNFNFLNSIQFDVGADGQPTATIAQENPVPTNVSTFACDLDNVQLLPYVAAPTMSITANAAGQLPTDNTTITIDAVFSVTAKL